MIGLFVSLILRICEAVAKIVTFIVIKLKLALPVVYIIVGFITNLIWHYLDNDTYRMLYNIGLVLCCIYSVFALIRAISKPFAYSGGYDRPNPSHIVEDSEVGGVCSNEYYEAPEVYEVAQNPHFIMYEYSSKVELFRKLEDGSLQYVRTDYKRRNS